MYCVFYLMVATLWNELVFLSPSVCHWIMDFSFQKKSWVIKGCCNSDWERSLDGPRLSNWSWICFRLSKALSTLTWMLPNSFLFHILRFVSRLFSFCKKKTNKNLHRATSMGGLGASSSQILRNLKKLRKKQKRIDSVAARGTEGNGLI